MSEQLMDGDEGAYVPCPDAAAAEPSSSDTAGVLTGYEAGYAPPGQGAYSVPAANDDAVALAGHEVGFVADPCGCADTGAWDNFNRSVAAPGLGNTSRHNAPYTLGENETLGNDTTYVTGTRGHLGFIVQIGMQAPAVYGTAAFTYIPGTTALTVCCKGNFSSPPTFSTGYSTNDFFFVQLGYIDPAPFSPFQGVAVCNLEYDAGAGAGTYIKGNAGSYGPFSVVYGDDYQFKWVAENGETDLTYRAKYWHDGDSEPGWQTSFHAGGSWYPHSPNVVRVLLQSIWGPTGTGDGGYEIWTNYDFVDVFPEG